MESDLINRTIESLWEDHTDAQIAEACGVTRKAIKCRRLSLGLRRKELEFTQSMAAVLDRAHMAYCGDMSGYESAKQVKSLKVSSRKKLNENDIETSVVTYLPEQSGPAWPVVQQPSPVVYTLSKSINYVNQGLQRWRQCVVLPDLHIGYRYTADAETIMHSEENMSIALQVVADIDPELVILNGDMLDLAEWSRHEKEPNCAFTTQKVLNRAYQFLAQLRGVAPKARIVFLEGNHDVRMSKFIMNNAAAAFGLKQACIPLSWPVLSVPHLLRMDELKIEYLGGWPNNEFWFGPIKVIHGVKCKATAVANDENCTVIQGHSHRIAAEAKTRKIRGDYKTNYAHMIGTLARTDGCLPSSKSSLDTITTMPVPAQEGWQAGFAVLSILSEDESMYNVEQIRIENNKAIFRDFVYEPKG